jgi:hypothetical protein
MLIMELNQKHLILTFEKNQLVKDVTFKSLILLYEKIKKNWKIIEVENLLNKFETEMKSIIKPKKQIYIKLKFAIRLTKKTLSKIVVKYFDKRKETHNITTIDLYFMKTYFL